MSSDRTALIRKAIDEAKPAEEYFAEQAQLEEAEAARIQKLDDCLDFCLQVDEDTIQDGSLNRNELRAVASVITYVADTQQASTETVCCMLKTAFGVDDLRNIDQNDYDDAIRFLLNLNVNDLLN